eukprot:COSAG02_NODE_1595_length_11773_cov_5.122739_10_plen_65_part_00
MAKGRCEWVCKWLKAEVNATCGTRFANPNSPPANSCGVALLTNCDWELLHKPPPSPELELLPFF